MGFSDTFNAVYGARIKAAELGLQRDQLRNQTATTIANLNKAGFNYDPNTGEVTRNNIGKLTDENTQLQLQQQNELLHKIHTNQIAQESANVVAKSIQSGNWGIFNKFIQQNPDVKKAISGMGYTAVRSVNSQTDMSLIEPFLKVDNTTQDYNHDGKVNQADLVYAYKNNIDGFRDKFNKNNLIAINTKGNPELIPTSSLLAATNTMSKLSASDTNIVMKTYNDYVNTTKGLLGITEAKINTEKAKQAQDLTTANANIARTNLYKAQTNNEGVKANLFKAETDFYNAKTASAKISALNTLTENAIKQYNLDNKKAINNVETNINNYSNIALSANKVDPKDLAAMKIYSDNIGSKLVTTKEHNNLDASTNMVVNGNKLLNYLNSSKIDMNAIQNIKSLYHKYFGAPKEEKDNIKKLWRVEAEKGNLMAQYLLDMSGQNVTDNEFKRTTNYAFGTDWQNIDSIKVHFKAFLEAEKQKAITDLKRIAKKDPYTAYTYRLQLGDIDTNSNNQSTNQSTKSTQKPSLDSFWKGN